MFADRFVERVELESRRSPLAIFDALREIAQGRNESVVVRQRAVNALSIAGNQESFRIQENAFGAPLECVGAIEVLSSGSRLSAEFRFARSTYLGWLAFIAGVAAATFYDAYWGERSPNSFMLSLGYASLMSILAALVGFGVLYDGWSRLAPMRERFRELLVSAVDEEGAAISPSSKAHAQTEIS